MHMPSLCLFVCKCAANYGGENGPEVTGPIKDVCLIDLYVPFAYVALSLVPSQRFFRIIRILAQLETI